MTYDESGKILSKKSRFSFRIRKFLPIFAHRLDKRWTKADAKLTIKKTFMKRDQFLKALEIITEHHSTQISINLPKGDSCCFMSEGQIRLHINKCVPAVIKKLNEAGFSMEMTEQGLLVFVI